MTDIVETLKAQLRKGYELGDGNLCLVASRDLETFIAEIERLRAALQRIDGINDNPACFNLMIEEVLRAALKDATPDDMQAILESVKKQATEVRIGIASSQADQKLANALACLAEVVTALRPKP